MHVAIKHRETDEDEFLQGVEAVVFKDHVRIIFVDRREDIDLFPGEYFSIACISEAP